MAPDVAFEDDQLSFGVGVMRFGLRSMFLCVAVAAMLCAAVGSIRGCHYTQVRTVDAVLSEYPEIDKVWFCTNDDVELEVEEVYFTTVSDPELIYKSEGIDTLSESEFRTCLERALREKRSVQLPACASPHWR